MIYVVLNLIHRPLKVYEKSGENKNLEKYFIKRFANDYWVHTLNCLIAYLLAIFSWNIKDAIMPNMGQKLQLTTREDPQKIKCTFSSSSTTNSQKQKCRWPVLRYNETFSPQNQYATRNDQKYIKSNVWIVYS